jgi:hypothetical protein
LSSPKRMGATVKPSRNSQKACAAGLSSPRERAGDLDLVVRSVECVTLVAINLASWRF